MPLHHASICRKCWNKNNPNRAPYRIPDEPAMICCFCGKETSEGIYVMHDQELLGCPHSKKYIKSLKKEA